MQFAEIAHDSRDFFQFGLCRSAPAAFAGYDHILAAVLLHHHDGLQHAMLADGGGELAELGGVEFAAGLIGIGLNLIKRQENDRFFAYLILDIQLNAVRDQRGEAATQTFFGH